MLELQPTFTIKFHEGNEQTIDLVTIEKLRAISKEDLQHVINDPLFVPYQRMITDNQIVLNNGFYMLRSAVQVKNTEIGNQLPPELITSTRYPISEKYVNQLLKNMQNSFALEAFNSLSCISHQTPVLGRYPALPNYKFFKFFGNSLQQDFGAVQLGSQIYKLFDNVLIDQNVVRIERIVVIDSEGSKQIIVAGCSQEGIPFVATPAMVQPTTQQNIQFELPKPQCFKYLMEQLDIHQLTSTGQTDQLDTDMRFGNNFCSVNGLLLSKKDTSCCPASLVDVLTAKFEFVQGKILSIQTQIPVDFKQIKLDNKTFYSMEMNLENTDTILTEQEVSDAKEFLCKNIQTNLNQVNYEPLKQQKMVEKRMHCVFCAREVNDSSLSFIFALPMLKRPIFQAVFNPPILVSCHKKCIEMVPEIILEDILIKGEEPLEFQVEGEDIIQLLIYDRYLRKHTLEHQKINYEHFRDALQRERIELPCEICGKLGAVIGCFNKHCNFTAHYDCIIQNGGKFDGKQFFCKAHRK
uniref:Zinc finger PHD-type domain-containing protein n=1 Tax=Trepomonas sp. PC1 TaxID=1076344 RepID=A0A146KDM8_9EUKA|eukprot:JAP94853.1 hypothetical protein TPC1_12345 [Trepomonas sp. PC1]